MMLFSTGTRLERVGVVGLDSDCWRDGMQAFLNCLGRGRLAAALSNQDMTATTLIGLLWVWHSSTKTTKMGGRRGLRPWLLRCLSQFLSERKERLLRMLRFCVPFNDGTALYL